MGVTDHSEYVGTVALANDPELGDLRSCRSPRS